MTIRSFADADTAKFFEMGKIGKGVGRSALASVARRELDMVHYAARLEDLRSPPGNRLEALSADRAGYHSIRINDQWRVVFRWQATWPEEVEICDYHG